MRSLPVTTAGHATNIGLIGALTLALMPAMISAAGPSAWSAVAIGQAIGAIVAVVIGGGWELTGPIELARSTRSVRRSIYVDSVRARLTLALPCLLVGSALSVAIAPAFPLPSLFGMLTIGLLGLTSNWYFVGIQHPTRMLAFETLPRVLGMVAALVCLLTGGPLVLALLFIIAGVIAAAIASFAAIMRSEDRRSTRESRTPLLRLLSSGWSSVVTLLVGAASQTIPLLLVGATSMLSMTAQFALLDKVQRQSQTLLAPTVNALHGWVPSADGHEEERRRMRTAFLIGGGVLLGAPFIAWWLGPMVIRLLSAGQIEIPTAPIVLAGCLVGLSYTEAIAVRSVLMPLALNYTTTWITLVTAALGILLVLPLAGAYGLVGALSALVIGQTARVAALITVALIALSTRKEGGLRPSAGEQAPVSPSPGAASASGETESPRQL